MKNKSNENNNQFQNRQSKSDMLDRLDAERKKIQQQNTKNFILKLSRNTIQTILATLGLRGKVSAISAEEFALLLLQIPAESNHSSLLDRYILVGNALINSGRPKEGIEVFSGILEKDPYCVPAMIGRGIGHVLSNNVIESIKDLTKAIETDKTSYDAYAQRAHVRTAIGDSYGGIEDISCAIEILQKKYTDENDETKKKTYHNLLLQLTTNKGMQYIQMQEYKLASEELSQIIKEQPDNIEARSKFAYTQLAQGNIDEAIDNYNHVLKIQPDHIQALTNLGLCWSQKSNPQLALENLDKALAIDPNFNDALAERLSVLFLSGQRKEMLSFAKDAAKRAPKNANVLRYLPNILHGLGCFKEASRAYKDVLRADPNDRAWYQREYALFLHHHMSDDFDKYNPDDILNPAFKECWCKGLPSKIAITNGYKHQSSTFVKENKDIPLDLSVSEDPQMTELLSTATKVGSQMQYSAVGFFSNTRHLRIAGLAAIHAAQKLTAAFQSGTELSWRDFYSTIVKWRQVYEPTEAVWWVDKLTPKQFEEGFGSCTSMILGQTKVTRYKPMIDRSLDIVRKLLTTSGAYLPNVNQPSQPFDKEKVNGTSTANELLDIVGSDFWVCTPCRSSINPDKTYEGTRITIQKMPAHGVHFSIRTACTPWRWKQFSEELDAAWSKLLETAKSNDVETKTNAMFKVLFYWYNFMPLSRGTAAVGFISLLAMTMSLFDTRLQTPLPKSLQIDWEAILEENCSTFTDKIRKIWFDDALKQALKSTSTPNYANTLPTVDSVVKTLGDAFICLNANI